MGLEIRTSFTIGPIEVTHTRAITQQMEKVTGNGITEADFAIPGEKGGVIKRAVRVPLGIGNMISQAGCDIPIAPDQITVLKQGRIFTRSVRGT